MNRRKIAKAITRLKGLPRGKNLALYLSNKARHYCLKAARSTKVAYPSTVMLELTNLCNLACTTCPREYEYGKAMDKGQMDLAKAKMIIDELLPYLDSIGLTGMGETFLYKEIVQVVDYIRSKSQGIIISISTNAVVPNFVEKASQVVGKVDTIQISIDGVGDVYEAIRRNASFSQFDTNLRKLSEISRNTRTDLVFNMVVTKENYHHMPLVVDYAKEVGVKYVEFTIFNLACVTSIDRSYYGFYKSPEFKKALLELDEAQQRNPEVIVNKRNFNAKARFKSCPFPWSHFYICWNGYVVPCCAKPFPKELNFGNAFEKGIMAVLNSEDFRRFRRLWFENKPPAFCDKCHFIELDLGGN